MPINKTAMFSLKRSLDAWGTSAFPTTFQQEVESLDPSLLPLQRGLAHSSCVSDEPFKVMIIGKQETDTTISVHTGLFYSGILAGCNCADDPTPIDTQPEYCEMNFTIDKRSAAAEASLSID